MALLGPILELLAPTRCAACDERVRPGVLFCAACAPSVLPARHEEGLAAFAYGGAPATAIARLKYGGHSELGPRLGEALARVAQKVAGQVDLVAPVPLHPRRLADRGFNQSALLAAPVARALGVPYRPFALVRIRDTPRQATLDRIARARNVEGAFVAREVVRGLRIALVDDVQTTGATLDACAKVLASAGARAVIPLVIARKD